MNLKTVQHVGVVGATALISATLCCVLPAVVVGGGAATLLDRFGAGAELWLGLTAGALALSAMGLRTLWRKRARARSAKSLPIVCNVDVFSKEERAKELELNIDVILRWPKSRQRLPNGFLFQYQGGEELFLTLARYAANEHRCCSWLSFAVEIEPFAVGKTGSIQLRMLTDSPEGKAFLESGFKFLTDEVGAGKVAVDSEVVIQEWVKFQASLGGKPSAWKGPLPSCGC